MVSEALRNGPETIGKMTKRNHPKLYETSMKLHRNHPKPFQLPPSETAKPCTYRVHGSAFRGPGRVSWIGGRSNVLGLRLDCTKALTHTFFLQGKHLFTDPFDTEVDCVDAM
jgi:hypothetical protein